MLTLLKTGLCFLRPKGASEAHLYNLLQNYKYTHDTATKIEIKWNFSGKWRSCANKYHERDKIWLVGVYWSVEKNFLMDWICNKIIKKVPETLSIET